MKTPKITILILCFIAGFTTLVYEILFARIFSLVTGSTIISVALVVAVFMAGIGFGSLIFGRIADAISKPLRLFSLLEFGIGASGILYAFLWTRLPFLFRTLTQVLGPSISNLETIVFAVFIIFLPCLFMGGVLPVLTKVFITRTSEIAKGVGTLYAVNTFGSIIGACVTGFYLIRAFGHTNTLLVMAILNIGIALFAYTQSSIPPRKKPATIAPTPQPATDARQLVLLGIAAFSGLCALSYEVLWMRTLSSFLANSTYNFTSVLIIFLCGITLGSVVFRRFCTGHVQPSLLAICQGAIGLFAIATTLFLNDLPTLLYFFKPIIDEGILRIVLPSTILAGILALVPTVLMGISFPLLCALYTCHVSRIGRHIGRVFFVNTSGALIGSLLAGFVLVPFIGIARGFAIIACLNIVLGAILLIAYKKTHGFITIGYSMALIVAVVLSIRTMDTHVILPPSVFRTTSRHDTLLYYKETKDGTVIVTEDQRTSIRACYVNNSAVCGTTYDALKVVKMLGHLPFFFNKDAQDILVVGFGIGITASAAAQHDIAYIDCVEICPGVKEAASFFEDYNHHVVQDSRVNFIAGDARTHILLTSKKYDIISCDPTHPTLGCNNLYTKEYYELYKRILKPDGIVCQYLPLHKVSTEEFRILITTFTSVFPYATVWLGYSHGILLAGNVPITADFSSLKNELQVLGDDILNDPYLLATSLILDHNAIRLFTKGTLCNTDDRPFLEFFTPRSMDRHNWSENLYSLIKYRISPHVVISGITDRGLLERYLAGQRYFLSALIFKEQGNTQNMLDALASAAHINPENQEIQLVFESELQQIGFPIFPIDK